MVSMKLFSLLFLNRWTAYILPHFCASMMIKVFNRWYTNTWGNTLPILIVVKKTFRVLEK